MTCFPNPSIRFACDSCAGTGREHHRYAVDAYRIVGVCPDCNGTGEQRCQDCGQEPASAEYELGARGWLLCAGCMASWLEADDAFHTDSEKEAQR